MTHAITYQKTYLNQSANQILDAAQISVTAAGTAEITHPNYPGCILSKDNDGDLVISGSDGTVVGLICGQQAAAKLEAIHDACEATQVDLLKAKDMRDGTTYADYL